MLFGYSKIFATPHYIERDLETSKQDILARVKLLNEIIKDNEVEIEVYIGNEVYVSSGILEPLYSNKICTLGNSKYVLVELPMQGRVQSLEIIIDELIFKGYVPIIAHPERYDFVYKNYKELNKLINIGALMQLNIGSIVGIYGTRAKKNAINLLKDNMINFIATDAHNSKKIYDIYDKAIKKIEKIIDKEKFHKIFYENPKHIVNNTKII